jgi:hypothetical protein
VLIMIDDAGFTDLGAYGSEISTPNIDSLAASGVMFSNFHAVAHLCAVARDVDDRGAQSSRRRSHAEPPQASRAR